MSLQFILVMALVGAALPVGAATFRLPTVWTHRAREGVFGGGSRHAHATANWARGHGPDAAYCGSHESDELSRGDLRDL
jgi:hypothetical protein